MPGTAETGDRFGEVLSPLASGGVVVGVPREDLGTARDAGALWLMPTDAAGEWTGGQLWSQDTPGVPDTGEAGDRFGASVGDRFGTIVVGVPGEDAGALRDSGLAQVFRESEVGVGLVPGRVITQDSKGIPGRAEAGDRFGAAVAVGVSLDGPGSGTVDAAIGAPGEDLGSVRDAGTIVLVPVKGSNPRAAMPLQQGQRLSGKPESGDAVGSVLTVTRGGVHDDEDYSDRLLVGVPAEALHGRTDAGMVEWPLWGTSRKPPLNLTFSGGSRTARNYGQVLPSSAD